MRDMVPEQAAWFPPGYVPPTRVVYGEGALDQVGEATRELGGRRVLLVTDPGLEEAGHPRRAQAALETAGLEVFVFDGVRENPTTHHVEAGTEIAARHQIDSLVAVGGGSAMDCAKGINFLYTNGGPMARFQGNGRAEKPMLPSLAIPTTAGTGSEGQSYALIADAKTHVKMACGDKKCAFRVAILDPLVTLSQPAKVTALTGIDAISHALESYVCTRRNDLSQALSRSAWKLLGPNLPRVLRQPSDLKARAAMQVGAHLAGVAIENAMLGAAHACANPLTAVFGLTHGHAVGIMLPWVIRFNKEAVASLYAELDGDLADAGASETAPERLAQRVTALLEEAELPVRLGDIGISASSLPSLAEKALSQWTVRFNPRPLDQQAIRHLYTAAL